MTCGAPSTSAVAQEHRAELNAGRAEARTLSEALVIDQGLLLASVLPELPAPIQRAVREADDLGILDVIVLNGVGHDDFADKMIEASEKPLRTRRSRAYL